MSTARIHIVAKDDPNRPFAVKEALDCSPPFGKPRLIAVLSKIVRRAA
jgi:hypothetical protein